MDGQTDELVTAATAFVAAVKAGDISSAKAQYPTTRTYYERIEQVGSGDPNGLTQEFEELNLDLTDDRDTPLIDADAHVRLASHQHLNGIRILRRGYNFIDGSDGFGHLDAGLFFIAFVRNPLTQFIPMQSELARRDALNEYITHTGSGIFACPPGLRDGEYWGSTLFG